MTEPDWKPFVIDEMYDPPGVKLNKIQTFMSTFIKWREGLKAEPQEHSQTVLVEHLPTPSKKASRRKRASK